MTAVVEGADAAALVQSTISGTVVFDEDMSVPIITKALTLRPADQSLTLKSVDQSLSFIIDPIDPVLPSTIFYDPRNSQYIPLLFRAL